MSHPMRNAFTSLLALAISTSALAAEPGLPAVGVCNSQAMDARRAAVSACIESHPTGDTSAKLKVFDFCASVGEMICVAPSAGSAVCAGEDIQTWGAILQSCEITKAKAKGRTKKADENCVDFANNFCTLAR